MKPEIKATIEYIVAHFSKELYYYTVEGVKDTAHVPPGSQTKPGSWTTYLLQYLEETPDLSPTLCDLRESIKFQYEAFKKLQEKEPKLKDKELRLIELERTLTAILCYRSCLVGDYETFVETQKGLSDTLNPENFKTLHETMQAILPNSDSREALEALIIFSDLGKSPETRELAEMEGIDATLDTDDLMLAILQLPEDKIEKIIPRYKHLNESAKQLLKDAYPFMAICFGHLFFWEGNAKTLEDIERVLQKMQNMSPSIEPKRRQKLLNLVFAAQFFDATGAQGQTFMYGSRTCTNNFYRGYMFMLETMQKLHQQSAEIVSEAYRTQRAEWMGLNISQFEKKDDFDVVLRLGCTLRLFDTEADRATAQAFKDAFYRLSLEHQQLLSEELNFNNLEGLNQFAHSPNYIATGGQNICRNKPGTSLSAEDIQNVLNYTIVLARLIKKLRTEYTVIIQDPVLPLNFGGVAALANGDKGPENVSNPDSVDLDALLAAEPILPKTTMERLEQPAKKAVIQNKWTNRPSPNGTIKNLIFDLGHVFVRIDTSRITVFKAFSQLAKKQGKNLSTADIQQIFTSTKLDQIVEGAEMSSVDKIVVDFHRGKTTKNQFRRAITKALGLDPVSNTEFDRAWTASILGTKKEVAERLAYLEQLRDQGYNIFLLSNNNKIHRLHTKTHYEGNHWQDKFMHQYYSDDTGNYKPDTEAFEQILRENNLQPEQTLFFDDSLKYVQKAHELDIHARQFTVNRMVNDVSLAIRAANKVESLEETQVDKLLSSSMDSIQLEEQYTKPEERKRAASLMAFTFLKFKENADRKKQSREVNSKSILTNSVEAISDIIEHKIELDQKLSAEMALTINKNFVMKMIMEAITVLPVSAESIIRVIKNDKIRIICTTIDALQRMTGNTASACFSPDSMSLSLTATHLSLSVIVHEFRHADIFLRHMNITTKDVMTAMLPIKYTNVEAYIQALDRGDNRIREYKKLWEQVQAGNKSSNDDDSQLQIYENAAKDCLLPLIHDVNSIEVLQALKKLNMGVGSTLKKGFETMKILDMRVENNKLIIAMEPTQPAVGVFQILDDVFDKLSSDNYRHKCSMEKLFERDAYTFQRLSLNAIIIFYPEAQKMIEADIQEYNTYLSQSILKDFSSAATSTMVAETLPVQKKINTQATNSAKVGKFSASDPAKELRCRAASRSITPKDFENYLKKLTPAIINTPATTGMYALHHAAQNLDIPKVKLLIHYQADCSLLSNGKTALTLAKEQENCPQELLQLLSVNHSNSVTRQLI